jgi:hypothetical protein
MSSKDTHVLSDSIVLGEAFFNKFDPESTDIDVLGVDQLQKVVSKRSERKVRVEVKGIEFDWIL